MEKEQLNKSENVNILTDEEMQEYKRLKAKEEAEIKSRIVYEEPEVNHFVRAVIVGTVLYSIIGMVLLLFAFSDKYFSWGFFVGGGILVVCIVESIIVAKCKDKTPGVLKGIFWVINAIPYSICYVFLFLCHILNEMG